jgi:mono/diheme cytochrome c family protein
MMMRRERWAIVLVLLLLGGVPLALALPGALRAGLAASGRQVIDIVARAPEAGGWSPQEIVVPAGEPLRLRLRAEDVAHGFTIAHLGVSAERIEPGKIVELDLPALPPGLYPFYCDVWCGPQHYRMRGALVVKGPDGQAPEFPVPAVDPNVDPDAPHAARFYPRVPPSAERGAAVAARLGARVPAVLGTGRLFATNTPEDLYLTLRTAAELNDADAWDLLAYLWKQELDPAEWTRGQGLYARNCAVCHGPGGRGNGPAAQAQPKRPANFTDPQQMAGASEAILRAKIVRGGMGSGMPYWGRLFGEEDVRALLSYLWGFLFNQPGQE